MPSFATDAVSGILLAQMAGKDCRFFGAGEEMGAQMLRLTVGMRSGWQPTNGNTNTNNTLLTQVIGALLTQGSTVSPARGLTGNPGNQLQLRQPPFL